MKRFVAIILSLILLCTSFAYAEDTDPEKKAENIFQNLNVLYEGAFRYLYELEDVWNRIVLDGKTDIDKMWFDENVLCIGKATGGRYSDILKWGVHNGYTFTDVNNFYDLMFMPLFERTGNSRDACLLFIMLVYYDTTSPEKILPFKDRIIELKAEAPDYEYLKELQNFYRKTNELIDYAQNGNIADLPTLKQKVSNFEEARVQIKSDFIFAYDWIDWTYFAFDLDDDFKNFFAQYSENKIAAEAAQKQPIYDEALRLESDGNKAEANGLFASLENYLDSAEKFDAHYCSKTLSTIQRSSILPVKYGDYYVFLDRNGRPLFSGLYDWVGDSSNGMFAVMKDDKRGYINTSGELVVPLKWTSVSEYSVNGTAFVYSESDGYWSEIDKSGNVVRDHLGNPTILFEDQADGVWIPFKGSYIDNTGSTALSGDWDKGYNFYNDYAVVSKDDKFGLIDRKGVYIIPCEYDSIINGGTCFALIKYGYLTIQDETGNTLF